MKHFIVEQSIGLKGGGICMKNTFSRLFGFGDKESEFELQDESHEEIAKKVYEEIQEIPIVNITPNRYQPRTVFDDARN